MITTILERKDKQGKPVYSFKCKCGVVKSKRKYI
jgi:hypothetical protein